jgi:hypothetical protein
MSSLRLVAAREFEQALRDGGLVKSDPEVGIGRQLHYPKGPARTVVVQFLDGDPTAYRSGVAKRVLDIADTWFLFPRYGALPDFGLLDVNDQSVAVEFGPDARALLAEYLATRPMEFGKSGLDLYAVTKEGQVLVTWDHHTEQDGLCVQLLRVDEATKLVASLCSFGSELAVFSKVWGDGRPDV